MQQADAATKEQAANLDRARAAVQERTQQVAVMQAQQASAETSIRQQQAALRLAQLNVGWTVIRSPIDGVLATRQVRIGDLVEPGARITTVTPLNSVWVSANFSERQITHMHPGQQALMRADTWPDIEIRGHVADLAPATGAQFAAMPADNTTGNYTKVVQRVQVKIVLDPAHNPLQGQLRPGMSMLARVMTGGPRYDVHELR